MRRISLLVGKKSRIEDVSFTASKHLQKPTSEVPQRITSRINSLGFNIEQVKTEENNDLLMVNSKELVQKVTLK
jgi:hypothetical protein